jgi:hypothetical protein
MKHKKKLIESAKARVTGTIPYCHGKVPHSRKLTTVCGTGGDICFCGQKQTLIKTIIIPSYHQFEENIQKSVNIFIRNYCLEYYDQFKTIIKLILHTLYVYNSNYN